MTLDKVPLIRTVVNKTDNIDSTFRFFKMEVLAGEEDFMATVKENSCEFTFDFSKVYWNSRLSTEHANVVKMLKRRDVVLDMFAGVGPFAIPAAKIKGCTVHANDLNPHAYKYLLENAQKNHVATKVTAYNLDGRDFIITLTKDLVKKVLSSSSKEEVYSHVLMNLPGSALEFLDVFRGLFNFVPEPSRPLIKLPTIHCYCFVRDKVKSERMQATLDLITSHLKVTDLKKESSSVTEVRSVAPNKHMMRASFRLPREVAYWSEEGETSIGDEEFPAEDNTTEDCTDDEVVEGGARGLFNSGE